MFRIDRIRAVYAAALLSLSAALAGCSGADFEAMLSRETEEATSLSPGEEPVDQVISMQDEDGGEERRFSQSSGVSGGEGLPQDTGAGDVQGLPQGAAESVSLTELPKYVFQTGDGHLLLLGDRVELMNINTLETERCLDDTGLDFSFHDFGSCKFAACKDEYLVVGNYLQMEKAGNGNFYTSSEEPKLMMVRFSRSLEILEVLNLGEVMGVNRGIDKYDLVRQGTRLLCASLEGCFLYDLERSELVTYKLAEEKLYAVSALGYMESEDKILFAAFYDDGSRDSQHVLGSMSSDGTNLQHEKKQTQEWGEIWCFQDFALLEDGKLYKSGERGKVFYYGADGRIREYALADEYTFIQPSDTGKYFAVQSRKWAEDGSGIGYTVRVYESESGHLIRTIECPDTEKGVNTMLCQCIVSEETDSVLLLFCDRETEGSPRFQVVGMKRR